LSAILTVFILPVNFSLKFVRDLDLKAINLYCVQFSLRFVKNLVSNWFRNASTLFFWNHILAAMDFMGLSLRLRLKLWGSELRPPWH